MIVAWIIMGASMIDDDLRMELAAAVRIVQMALAVYSMCVATNVCCGRDGMGMLLMPCLWRNLGKWPGASHIVTCWRMSGTHAFLPCMGLQVHACVVFMASTADRGGHGLGAA